MSFQGKYFDGFDLTGYKAQVTLGMYVIQINYTDNNGMPCSITWNPENIHRGDFAVNDMVRLKYGEAPFQFLEVTDIAFISALKTAYPKAKFHHSRYYPILNSGLPALLAIISGFIGVMALLYFVIVPFAAERMAMHIPVSWETEMGTAAFNNIRQSENIDHNNSERLTAFFRQMHYPSNYDIEVYAVNSPTVNAFALPGGKIVVYTGIIRSMNSYEELAALLSHEFSHVQLRHSTRSIFRTYSSYLFISLLLGHSGGVTAVIVQNANQLKQLGYSRQLEEDADRNGLKLMDGQHINPKGMQDLFTALQKSEKGENIPQFLSTHPLTSSRIDEVKRVISQASYKPLYNQPLDSLWSEIKINCDTTAIYQ